MGLELQTGNCNDKDDFRKGEVIFLEGEEADTIYIINAGKVGLFLASKGRLVSVDTVKQGEFLGVDHLLTDDKLKFTAIALEGVNLVRIKKKHMLEVIDKCPNWITDILETIFERLDGSLNLLEEHNITDDRVFTKTRLSREQEADFHQAISKFKGEE